MDDNTDNDPWFARARAYLARTSAESAWSAAVEARVEAQKTLMAVENAVDKAQDVVSATRSFLDVAEGIRDRGSEDSQPFLRAGAAWHDALTARNGFVDSLMAAEQAVDKAKHAVALTRRLRDSTLKVWDDDFANDPGYQKKKDHYLAQYSMFKANGGLEPSPMLPDDEGKGYDPLGSFALDSDRAEIWNAAYPGETNNGPASEL